MATAIQLHSEMSRSKRTSARRQTSPKADATPAPVARLLRKAAAILDRPIGSASACECEVCEAVSARTAYHCSVCGYRGAPAVFACLCDENRDQSIAFWEQFVRGAPPRLNVEKAEAQLEQLRGKPGQVCPPTLEGNPDGDCLHGMHFCPVCEDCGDGTRAKHNAAVGWSIISDLRSVFASLGHVQAPQPDFRERIIAVLDRPNPDMFRNDEQHDGIHFECDCPRCQTIRRSGITCTHCGFRGAPMVQDCSCEKDRAVNIQFYQERLGALAAGETPKRGEEDTYSSPAWLREELREELAKPDTMCDGGRCGHGTTWCPTCASLAGGEATVTAEDLLTTVRDLHAVLYATPATVRTV